MTNNSEDKHIGAGAAAAERQREHYERVRDVYASHYYDEWSMRYRSEFIIGPLLDGLDLANRRVADLACGDGHNSLLLRSVFPTVTTIGFDVSPSACAAYERNVGTKANCVNLLDPELPKVEFDAAIVIGGLHHLVADLGVALKNIRAMLKPGGMLLMFEPNAQFSLQWARAFWYRNDPMFDAQTEAALNHDRLLEAANGRFRREMLRFLGGPAFYLVLNSAILRIPIAIKRYVSPPLFALERLYGRIPTRGLHSSFIARWIAQ